MPPPETYKSEVLRTGFPHLRGDISRALLL